MTTVPDVTPQPDRLLRYNNVAIAIHWISVALIVTQIYVGFTFGELPRGPARGEWFAWHKTLGVTILLLSLFRLAWRLTHKPPPYPPQLPGWERHLAVWNHRIFYALLIVIPLTGLIAVSGRGGGTTELVGGIPFPLIPGITEAAAEPFGGIHELLVKLTIALVVIHAGAALKHQFWDKNRASGRMPPFRTTRDEPVVSAEGTS